MSELHTLILVTYYAALVVLVGFGAHRLALSCRLLTRKPPAPAPTLRDDDLPRVVVQLPMFNERYVARRLIDCVARFDYPADRWTLQVLDDSTDDTRCIVDNACDRAARAGVRVQVLRRDDRTGYKAGALRAGFEAEHADLYAVFDADFMPEPDYLRRMVGHFKDARVGMAQARWGHVNRDVSPITRAQEVLLDGHFVVEQSARTRSNLLFNFNGTAGIWRRQTIEDAGGWEHDTLTEDLDLSYRAQLHGWRFVYDTDTVAPAELPVLMSGFRSQQHRWAKGSIECLRKLFPRVARARISRTQRIEALIHLTANLSYLLILLLALLLPYAALARQVHGAPWMNALDIALLTIGVGCVTVFYALAQTQIGRTLPRALARIPWAVAMDIGLAFHKSRAVLEALVGYRTAFVRTPKHAIVTRSQRARAKASRYVSGSLVAGVPELLIAAWNLYGIVCVLRGPYPSLYPVPFLALFAIGFGAVGVLTVAERIPAPKPALPELDVSTT